MYSTRLIRLLMVALSIFTVAQATWFDFKVLARSPGLLDSLAAADNSTSTAEETKPAASASAAPSPDTTTAKAPRDYHQGSRQDHNRADKGTGPNHYPGRWQHHSHRCCAYHSQRRADNPQPGARPDD
ncbi:hypothetical protein PG987_005585 [Apiospora arundinis]